MGQKKSTLTLVSIARRTKIVVVDPYPVILHGVRKMVEVDSRFKVVAEASTLLDFQKKAIAAQPEVAVIDWYIASQNIELTKSLLQSGLLATSFIFLTVSENSQLKRQILGTGARAVFLSKWCSARRLRTAVSKACEVGVSPQSLPEHTTGDTFPPLPSAEAEQRFKLLTLRERQLIPLVCRGLKNKEIANRLGIAESTVWHHLTAVFTKLQVSDRLGLAAFAYSHQPPLPAVAPRPASTLRVLKHLPSSGLKYSPTAGGTEHRERSFQG